MKISDIRTVGIEVPMTFALGTSRGVITKAPLLLVDLVTSEGITGRTYIWSYTREVMPAIAGILRICVEEIRGDAIVPLDLNAKLARRFALIGKQGIVRMAAAAVDMAAWDALAQSLGCPLASLLG